MSQMENRYPFEVCQLDKKNYLENDLLRLPEEYFLDHTSEYQNKSLPLKCIQFAQKNFRGGFALCDSESSKPVAIKNSPCLSQRYVYLVYNAYHDVMDCFNLLPSDFYLQIMIESGFHINAFNKTGFDSGMAQFTGNGIRRIASSESRIARTHRLLLESSRPSCQRIASIVGSFDTQSFGIENRCNMIALPSNPYRAMLFNYLHSMLDQIELQRKLQTEFTDFPQLEKVLTASIRQQLAFLAYNRGMTGLKKLLRGYIENRQQMQQQLSESDFDLSQNLSKVKKILKLEPIKRDILLKAKIKKLSFAEYAVIRKATYVADMVEAKRYLKSQLGDSLSQQCSPSTSSLAGE